MYRKEKLYRRPEVLKLKFGERICAVRKSVGKNQKEFSAMLDIPQSTLSAYETDRMQPAIFNLVKIAKTFNVSMDWLCGLEKQESNSLDGKSIGLRIRALRIERGLTQTEFAKSLGKALRTVQKYESGEIELTIATVNEIAQKFGVSAAFLLGSEVNNADSPPPPTENPAPSVIILKGKDFSAKIPADVSPELLTVLLDKIDDKG